MPTTVDAYAPFDSGPGANVTEAGWQAMMRRMGNPGVIPGSLNGWQVYADSTGMQVKVKTGEGWAEGFWGSTSTERTLAIAAANATNPRKDLVVWRVDVTNNRVELDVITGTAAASPTEPALTRNTSVYETPLAVVDVPATDTSIDAAQVLDVRWFGGPPSPTLPDDNRMFGDQVSTCQRGTIAGTDTCPTGNTFLTLTQAIRAVTATNIRYYLATARSGGFADCRVYTGYSRHRLTDVTGNISITDTTGAGLVHVDALPSTLSIAAGQFVAIAYLTTVTTTAPVLGRGASVTSTEILNPSTTTLDPLGRWSTVFKTGQSTLASTITVHVDGTWSKRDRSFWFALG
jgi:hypothetical protein